MSKRNREQAKLKSAAQRMQAHISDKDFFTSGQMTRRFSAMADAITGRYGYGNKVRVCIDWLPKDNSLAYAIGNDVIHINIADAYLDRLSKIDMRAIETRIHEEFPGLTQGKVKQLAKRWAKPLSREDRYHILYGLFGHELGHILYTSGKDMLAMIESRYHMNKWYPKEPVVSGDDVARKKKLDQMFTTFKSKKQFIMLFCELLKYMHNVVEDGYVEYRVVLEYPGMLGYSLQLTRIFMAAAALNMDNLYDLMQKGAYDPYEVTTGAILKYVTTGTVNWHNVPPTAVPYQRFEEVRPLLDEALRTHEHLKRLDVINRILIRLADELIPMLKNKIKLHASAEELGKSLAERIGNVGDFSGGGLRSKEAICNLPPSFADEEEENNESEDGSETKNNTVSGGRYGLLERADNASGSASANQGGGRLGDEKTDSSPQCDDDVLAEYVEQEKREEISDTLNAIAYDMAASQAEEARTNKASRELKEMDLGEMNARIYRKFKRANTPSDLDIQLYSRRAALLKDWARKMSRSLLQKLHQKRNVLKVENLYMGRKLEAKNAYKNDGRLFSKKKLPSDGAEMAVAVLIDESGSMRSDGRISHATDMAILLYEFCHILAFPVMICGHRANCREDITIDSFVEFDEIDGLDRYRLLQLKANDCNRDGAAVRYMTNKLLSRPEVIKLLIIVSDGEPSAYSPTSTMSFREVGVMDTKEALRESKRKGITVISAGIGSDRDGLEEIYEEHFLDISDLSMLPVSMINMLKRFIDKAIR